MRALPVVDPTLPDDRNLLAGLAPAPAGVVADRSALLASVNLLGSRLAVAGCGPAGYCPKL